MIRKPPGEVIVERGPGTDSGYAREIASHRWFGKTLVSPQKSWRRSRGQGGLGLQDSRKLYLHHEAPKPHG